MRCQRHYVWSQIYENCWEETFQSARHQHLSAKQYVSTELWAKIHLKKKITKGWWLGGGMPSQSPDLNQTELQWGKFPLKTLYVCDWNLILILLQ